MRRLFNPPKIPIGFKRTDLGFEGGFHSVNDISCSSLRRTRAITLFISVTKKTQPQAVFSQMAIYVLCKAFPLFIRT